MAAGQWQGIVRRIRRLAGPDPTDADSDRRLLECFAGQRDEAAFTRLVERHGPMVLAICKRLLHDHEDAEDALQATFCVLARKARSMTWRDSIGGWLHAVACRVAGKAKARAARRRLQEGEALAMRSVRPSRPEVLLGELRDALDDELNRLPEKYRAPLVLCFLEGRTNDEAARQLGWPKGTVQGRLARGRDALRARLARRGLTLSAGTLATLGTSTALSAGMVESTVQTALKFAGGAGPAGISVSIAALAEGV